MNEKQELFLENMKSQTIGVEVEMANMTRSKAAKLAAEYFGTGHTVHHDGGCYDQWSCLDNKGRRWSFVTDSSIQCPRSQQCELTTPILHYEDIEDLQELIRIFRHNGAKSNPSLSCGVHIHIGAENHTAKTLRNLANIMASHEDLIIKSLNLDYSRTHTWCKPVDPYFLEEVNKKKPKTTAELADIWYHGPYSSNRMAHYNQSRYRMLNLHAYFTKGTVEFRLFQFDNPTDDRRGGLHAGQLKSYIQFCLALSQAALDSRSTSPKKVQMENEKYAMRTWLLRLNFIGDEFRTARDVLASRLSGDCSFRSGVRPASC